MPIFGLDIRRRLTRFRVVGRRSRYITYRPYVHVFREGPYLVAVDNKGREEIKSTDHAEVLQKAPEIYPTVIIDGELIIEKPIMYTGYDRLEIIGTPRAKILYYALKIREYIINTDWWYKNFGISSGWIVVFYLSNIKHVYIEGLYTEMLDLNDYIAANKPGGTTIMATTHKGPVENLVIKRCIFYNHLLRGVQCDAAEPGGGLMPRRFIVEDCWFQIPDEVDYQPYAINCPYGAEDIYIRRNYFRHHALDILIASPIRITIEENVCEYIDDTFITVYSHPDGPAAQSVVIRNNIIREPMMCGKLGINVYGWSGQWIDFVLIEGNRIHGDVFGILTYGGIRNLVIKNNGLILTYPAGIKVEYAGYENVLIEGNTLQNCYIEVEGGRVMIVNNIVTSPTLTINNTTRSTISLYYRGGNNEKGCVPVVRNNINFSIAGIYKESVPIGTSDAYGDPARWCSQWGKFYSVSCPDRVPLCICGNKIKFVKIEISGIAADETITVKFVGYKHYINLDEAEQTVLEKSFTADGTYYLTDEEIAQIEIGTAPGVPLVALDVYAKTNLDTTTASVIVTVGIED